MEIHLYLLDSFENVSKVYKEIKLINLGVIKTRVLLPGMSS